MTSGAPALIIGMRDTVDDHIGRMTQATAPSVVYIPDTALVALEKNRAHTLAVLDRNVPYAKA